MFSLCGSSQKPKRGLPGRDGGRDPDMDGNILTDADNARSAATGAFSVFNGENTISGWNMHKNNTMEPMKYTKNEPVKHAKDKHQKRGRKRQEQHREVHQGQAHAVHQGQADEAHRGEANEAHEVHFEDWPGAGRILMYSINVRETVQMASITFEKASE